MHSALINYLLLSSSALISGGVDATHILGLFVNVHRSQLLIYASVARVLLQRGHQLTLVSSMPLDELHLDLNATKQLRHVLIPWQQPAEVAHLPGDFLTRLQHMFARLEAAGEFLDDPIWQSFLYKQPAESYDLLLLGYHFNDHLLGVASHFDCPAVIISTQQPISFVHSLLGNPEERWYVTQPYDSRERTGFAALIFGLWEKSTEFYARRIMQRIYSKHFPSSSYASFDDSRRRVVLALNHHHMLSEGPIAPLLPTMLDIGGMHLEQTLPDMLPNISRSFIYFSLGTRFTWRTAPQHIVSAFVTAFAQLSDYDIYWTYDGSDVSALNLTYSHIKLSKWWLQQQLLANTHVRLFITHGGKGSLSEALYHAVPLLGLPLLGDQRANLKRMVRKGWGLSLDVHNVSSTTVLATLRQVLLQARFKQRILKDSLLYRDRPLNTSTLTAYWLEYVMRHKGAQHLQYMGRDMPTYQQYLMDIYVFIYGLLVLLIGIARWLDRRLN